MVRRVSKILKFAAILLGALAVLLVLAMLGAWQASQHEEEWYVEATTDVEPVVQEQLAEAGDELERQALNLRNEARHRGIWEAVFTDDQVNGWLAFDLKEKFPGKLPSTVRDPRVKFDANDAKVAFRVKTSKVDSVVVVAVDVYLTEQPNEVAVRLHDARAGLLPLPKKRVIDTVNKAARKANVRVTWAQNEGDPVALFVVPEQIKQIEGRLELEAVEVRDGEIYFTGRTIRADGSGGTTNVQNVIVSHLFDKRKVQR